MPSDYANMGMAQVKRKLSENKQKDLAHAKSLQCVISLSYCTDVT